MITRILFCVLAGLALACTSDTQGKGSLADAGRTFSGGPLYNECRLSNRMISTGSEEFRFVVDVPIPQ